MAQENQDQENDKELSDLNDDTLANTTFSSDNADYDSDMERYDQAVAASEPSFTLEPEKDMTPDPDSLNKDEEKNGNNLKK